MKKTLIGISIIFILLLCIAFYFYQTYLRKEEAVQRINTYFEAYTGKVFSGTDMVTLINRIEDLNRQNGVEQKENKEFMENDTNSIKADIYFTDNEKTYSIEAIFGGGIQNFARHFSNQSFRIKSIQYHETTKQIQWIHFEQT